MGMARWYTGLLAGLLLAPAGVAAAEVCVARPDSVGVSEERLRRLD